MSGGCSKHKQSVCVRERGAALWCLCVCLHVCPPGERGMMHSSRRCSTQEAVDLKARVILATTGA